jgi:cytochrome P450
MISDERFSASFDELRPDRMVGARHEAITGPVRDWETDFSHVEPEWADDPYRVYDELRKRCPIAHTDRFGGGWLPVRYDDVAAIAYDTDSFSSRSVVVSNVRPSLDLAPVGTSPPISSDPPFHREARRLLLPAFTKKAVETLEPATRAYCHELIDAFGDRRDVDAAVEYAQHIPVRVIADLLGLPIQDAPRFREIVANTLEAINLPPDERVARIGAQFDYFLGHIRDHVANPRDDLISHLIEAELNGERLDPLHVAGTISLLLIAGIDTTWSAIGASLWHLATHPEDRRRLVAEPGMLPTAIEEFLRAYAPVTMARLVRRDQHWRGVDMKADDWVLLSFPAANRDPDQFDRADEVVIDREVNRHAAFGLGIHRCIGSHLARMELRTALDVWLERVPEFTLADTGPVHWAPGQVRGPRTLPMHIG